MRSNMAAGDRRIMEEGTGQAGGCVGGEVMKSITSAFIENGTDPQNYDAVCIRELHKGAVTTPLCRIYSIGCHEGEWL